MRDAVAEAFGVASKAEADAGGGGGETAADASVTAEAAALSVEDEELEQLGVLSTQRERRLRAWATRRVLAPWARSVLGGEPLRFAPLLGKGVGSGGHADDGSNGDGDWPHAALVCARICAMMAKADAKM